jgi:hypothetical protein
MQGRTTSFIVSRKFLPLYVHFAFSIDQSGYNLSLPYLRTKLVDTILLLRTYLDSDAAWTVMLRKDVIRSRIDKLPIRLVP